jgi:sulfite exporter TauE/SafE
MNLWVIFITGLTVGGLTCLAVQGGLLASIIAAREEDQLEKEKRNKRGATVSFHTQTVWPTLVFLGSKLVAYTILGFILGAFGGVLNISPTVQIWMQFVAGLYMIAIALNLLNVHPIFRYAVIQPPRFLTRMVRNQSKSKDLFAPAFLGALTIFIPCGTTLAMEALAISSANAFLGAAIMAAFVLGTTPLFFGVGWRKKLKRSSRQRLTNSKRKC